MLDYHLLDVYLLKGGSIFFQLAATKLAAEVRQHIRTLRLDTFEYVKANLEY